jgi:hypothetical protein
MIYDTGRNPICESEWLHVRGLASTRIDCSVGYLRREVYRMARLSSSQNHLVEVIVITRLSHCMDVDFEWKLLSN